MCDRYWVVGRHPQPDRSRAGLGSSNKRGDLDEVPGHHPALCSCHRQQRDVLVHGCGVVGFGVAVVVVVVVATAVVVVVIGGGVVVVDGDAAAAAADVSGVTAADCDDDDDDDDAGEGRYWHCCILLQDC